MSQRIEERLVQRQERRHQERLVEHQRKVVQNKINDIGRVIRMLKADMGISDLQSPHIEFARVPSSPHRRQVANSTIVPRVLFDSHPSTSPQRYTPSPTKSLVHYRNNIPLGPSPTKSLVHYQNNIPLGPSPSKLPLSSPRRKQSALVIQEFKQKPCIKTRKHFNIKNGHVIQVDPFIPSLIPPLKRSWPTTNLEHNPIRNQFKRQLERGYDSLL